LTLLEENDMPDVEQIKAAIRKYDALVGSAPFSDLNHQPI
jgi:hypothetical protein